MLAVTLAVLSLVLALLNAWALSTKLIQQAQPQARQLADTAQSLFREQANSSLRWVAYELREQTGVKPWHASEFPRWINGLLFWDGESLTTIKRPAEFSTDMESLITARIIERESVAGEIAGDDDSPVALIHVTQPSPPTVLACTKAEFQRGSNVTIIAHIHLDYLREDIAEPLLAITRGLEIVPHDSDRETNPKTDLEREEWFHPMSGAFRYLAIRPTDEFLRDQQETILYQTLGYISLAVLSLLTLLSAMWFLLRVVRREVALAEMKSNFVADVSHELKTPLALIHMFGETLQSGRVTDEKKREEYYAIITRESGRLTNLIDNILDFARIDAGRKEYSTKPIDPAVLVKEIYEAYRWELEHDGFEHYLRIDAGLPAIDVDRDAIAQAIINLLSNAIKYSKTEKYVLIEVKPETRRGKKGVLISVYDRGIGIKPEDRAHLFDGFFRSSDQRVREKRGTGIGLALTKRIVDAHNGFLIVESRLVRGSTFRIFLPSMGTEQSEVFGETDRGDISPEHSDELPVDGIEPHNNS